jgi:hypothetical protein
MPAKGRKMKITRTLCCTTWRRKFALFSVAILCCFCLGCGPQAAKPVHVAGSVFLDGKPLAGGAIRIVPSRGRPAISSIDKAGRFTLSRLKRDDGCFPGAYRVEVAPIIPEGSTATSLIPTKYGSVETSGLAVTIDGPTDALKIDLSSKDSVKP